MSRHDPRILEQMSSRSLTHKNPGSRAHEYKHKQTIIYFLLFLSRGNETFSPPFFWANSWIQKAWNKFLFFCSGSRVPWWWWFWIWILRSASGLNCENSRVGYARKKNVEKLVELCSYREGNSKILDAFPRFVGELLQHHHMAQSCGNSCEREREWECVEFCLDFQARESFLNFEVLSAENQISLNFTSRVHFIRTNWELKLIFNQVLANEGKKGKVLLRILKNSKKICLEFLEFDEEVSGVSEFAWLFTHSTECKRWGSWAWGFF